MNRRKLPLALGLMLTASLLWAPGIDAETLDVSDPDQALLANNKLICANEPGEVSLYWCQGVVYSRIPGEKDRHLFDVQGMNVRQCGRFEDEVRGLGFRSVSREVMLYLDPETGDVKEWPSPSGPNSPPSALEVLADIIWYNESDQRPDALVRFDPETEKFQSWAIPSGIGIIRHMRKTPGGNLVIHQSHTNTVGLVMIP